MRSTTAIALALCVVLAGCSGLPGGGGDSTPTEEATPTATPGETPTETPTATPTPAPSEVLSDEELPPGLSADGIESPAALADAHQENLQATGAVTRFETATSSDSFETASNATTRIGSDETLSVVERTESGISNATARTYADGTQLFVNESVQGQTVYSSFSSEYVRSLATPEASIGQYLAIANFSVSSVDQRDDATLVTLTADAVNETELEQAEDASVEDVSGTLVVDLEGTIRSFSLHYEFASGDSTTASDIEYALEQRGIESVEEPAWVETASEQSISADLTYAVEDDVVAIHHEGGDAIPAGTQVSVVGTAFAEGRMDETETITLFSAQFEADFESGETAYVYQADEDALRGNATIGDRPDVDAVAVDDELLVQIVDSHTGETIDIAKVTVDDEDDS